MTIKFRRKQSQDGIGDFILLIRIACAMILVAFSSVPNLAIADDEVNSANCISYARPEICGVIEVVEEFRFSKDLKLTNVIDELSNSAPTEIRYFVSFWYLERLRLIDGLLSEREEEGLRRQFTIQTILAQRDGKFRSRVLTYLIYSTINHLEELDEFSDESELPIPFDIQFSQIDNLTRSQVYCFVYHDLPFLPESLVIESKNFKDCLNDI